ncbi:prepilin-type N-terminal cleavage/methylation domain-containing protein [Campylobacter canadensis]|uniref:prepilin-type N-terminal cleavage/methylation domain-containing protein n=1 Tax=Campylobacter canadensis TaxID=449520 RepID=UPI00155638C7|nr:prepilin-type N-terminal cleavage/methylation domain-containing protein [Campylobacter canadensis]MBZ7995652.1 prepilin-type N-terminal cleavage/methylation domain-containing protein [Campylobacter canadensis]
MLSIKKYNNNFINSFLIYSFYTKDINKQDINKQDINKQDINTKSIKKLTINTTSINKIKNTNISKVLNTNKGKYKDLNKVLNNKANNFTHNKQAYTLLELVIVIVIIAILSSVALSKIHSINSLEESARALMNDIKYAQINALSYDFYDGANNDDYKKKYFRLRFHCIANTYNAKYKKYICSKNKEIGYTIFADKAGKSSSNPDKNEIVKDYINKSLLIAAPFSGVSIDKSLFTPRANLSKSANIIKAAFYYYDNKAKIKKTSTIYFNEFGNLSSNIYDFNSIQHYYIKLSSKDDYICIKLNYIGFSKIVDKSECINFN